MMRYYVCEQCGPISDYRKDSKILDKCPKCGSKVRQQLGLNFKLSGDGWFSQNAGNMNNGG